MVWQLFGVLWVSVIFRRILVLRVDDVIQHDHPAESVTLLCASKVLMKARDSGNGNQNLDWRTMQTKNKSWPSTHNVTHSKCGFLGLCGVRGILPSTEATCVVIFLSLVFGNRRKYVVNILLCSKWKFAVEIHEISAIMRLAAEGCIEPVIPWVPLMTRLKAWPTYCIQNLTRVNKDRPGHSNRTGLQVHAAMGSTVDCVFHKKSKPIVHPP